MGVRLSLGLGYGILLTEDQKQKPLEDITNPLTQFLLSKINAFNDKKGKDDIDLENFMDTFWFASTIQHKYKEYDVETAIDIFLHDCVLCPQYEYGTRNFFGFIPEARYGNSIDYAMTFCVLKDQIPDDVKLGYSFEVKLPPTNMKHFSEKITDKNGNELIIPKRELLMSSELFAKAWSDRQEEDPTTFKSVERCDAFVESWHKCHSFEGMNFEHALSLVSVIFPDITMDDMDRYLVGWWS